MLRIYATGGVMRKLFGKIDGRQGRLRVYIPSASFPPFSAKITSTNPVSKLFGRHRLRLTSRFYIPIPFRLFIYFFSPVTPLSSAYTLQIPFGLYGHQSASSESS